MNKIVISTSSFDIANNPPIQRLIEAGFEVVTNPYKRKLSEDEIISLLGQDTIGLLAGIEPLTERVLTSTHQLKVISRCGTGLDSVDLAAAKRHNVAVFNTPEAPAQAVAELTLGLMLATLRQIGLIDRKLRDGEWPRTQGHLLAAQTVGIVGLGHIGRRVARLCQAFEATVVAHDPYLSQTQQGVSLMPLEQLLAESDIVTLHIPYSADTHHLLNKAAFSRMKSGAIVINAARGGLVDEAALYDALLAGHLKGAALDVFEQEPYQGPLLKCDNITLTSHIGSLAKESRHRMEIEAAENLLHGLSNIGLMNE
ncbi:D-3-phosphoglycerate dehydrogenase [Nitrosomonas nitrosa]|uniref:D-3-phosphoglycerate dehydrogenase n=1 Tax=Nitrosomonas nitrosa TaxID=52442 RepID=A0A8H8YXV6_9PROT|nr:phosphoglycerate dehydrogenase [Nitrosomonas nitrosa]MCO6434245.1 phosphoglycerate dehydrogenase [Nitrosomonas nitrosa]PTQ98854.1 D-3-phosphoglycerate dehydrogenase [Nitrosomonas nitrosa]CAE6493296.1 D-3-phosphoglycerate dehydrogenase [Nitrosomonas nitrosa]